jgi:ArsR family transcriptional regulator
MMNQALIPKVAVFKALAHPGRLAMVEALAEGERCVCELQRIVGSDMSTVSKHLALLKQAGVVQDRKEGLWVYYRLRTLCVVHMLNCLEPMLATEETHVTDIACPDGCGMKETAR